MILMILTILMNVMILMEALPVPIRLTTPMIPTAKRALMTPTLPGQVLPKTGRHLLTPGPPANLPVIRKIGKTAAAVLPQTGTGISGTIPSIPGFTAAAVLGKLGTKLKASGVLGAAPRGTGITGMTPESIGTHGTAAALPPGAGRAALTMDAAAQEQCRPLIGTGNPSTARKDETARFC